MLHIEVIVQFSQTLRPLQTNVKLKKILNNYLVKAF